ncbi:MAG: hypothetical protein M3R00_02000 [Pseudomonadota bacterium]|nr:hypothetical protein [Pseudomonadota bacterium]
MRKANKPNNPAPEERVSPSDISNDGISALKPRAEALVKRFAQTGLLLGLSYATKLANIENFNDEACNMLIARIQDKAANLDDKELLNLTKGTINVLIHYSNEVDIQKMATLINAVNTFNRAKNPEAKSLSLTEAAAILKTNPNIDHKKLEDINKLSEPKDDMAVRIKNRFPEMTSSRIDKACNIIKVCALPTSDNVLDMLSDVITRKSTKDILNFFNNSKERGVDVEKIADKFALQPDGQKSMTTAYNDVKATQPAHGGKLAVQNFKRAKTDNEAEASDLKPQPKAKGF